MLKGQAASCSAAQPHLHTEVWAASFLILREKHSGLFVFFIFFLLIYFFWPLILPGMKINGDTPQKREELLDCLCSYLSPPWSEQLIPSRSDMFILFFSIYCTKTVLLCFGNIVPQTSMLIKPRNHAPPSDIVIIKWIKRQWYDEWWIFLRFCGWFVQVVLT